MAAHSAESTLGGTKLNHLVARWQHYLHSVVYADDAEVDVDGNANAYDADDYYADEFDADVAASL